MDRFLSGEELYGEALSDQELERWFEDEREGYYDLEPRSTYVYGYTALNEFHGFRHLPHRHFQRVLGLGSALGDELAPISAEHVTVLEPASGFVNPNYTYVAPQLSGLMPFPDGSFDFVSCLGVLHHIPNVRTVVTEIYRVMQPGGYALIREPIISMGDWRHPRRGLTKHERGIPLEILRNYLIATGFEVVRESKCVFSLTSRLRYLVRGSVFNSSPVVRLDSLLSRLPLWSTCYHPGSWVQKIKPTAVFYVLRKPPTA